MFNLFFTGLKTKTSPLYVKLSERKLLDGGSVKTAFKYGIVDASIEKVGRRTATEKDLVDSFGSVLENNGFQLFNSKFSHLSVIQSSMTVEGQLFMLGVTCYLLCLR